MGAYLQELAERFHQNVLNDFFQGQYSDTVRYQKLREIKIKTCRIRTENLC